MRIGKTGIELGAGVLRRCGEWGRSLSTRILVKVPPVPVKLSNNRTILISPPLMLKTAIEEAISTRLGGVRKTVEVTQLHVSAVKELGSRIVEGSYSVGDLDVETERTDQHLILTFTGFTFATRQDGGIFAREWQGINLALNEIKFGSPVVTDGWYRIS